VAPAEVPVSRDLVEKIEHVQRLTLARLDLHLVATPTMLSLVEPSVYAAWADDEDYEGISAVYSIQYQDDDLEAALERLCSHFLLHSSIWTSDVAES
jgi:hypothetical protein